MSHQKSINTLKKNNKEYYFSEKTALHCTVSKIYKETSHCISIELTQNNKNLPLFIAGQYLILTVNINGTELSRCYSLSSSPKKLTHYRITIQRIEGGIVSNWLCDNVFIGMKMKFSLPQGDFILPLENTPKKLAFFAAGSGITPFISMLHTLTTINKQIDLALFISTKNHASFIFQKELSALIDKLPHCTVTINYTAEHSETGLYGRLTQKNIQEKCSDITERNIFISGSNGFIATIQTNIKALGVEDKNINKEAFYAENKQNNIKKQITVNLLDQGIKIITDGTQSFLELAENNKAYIPSVCRSGMCGACSIKVKGKSRSLGREALDDTSFNKGVRLACMTYPNGDCDVQLS